MLSAWHWHPSVLLGCAALVAGYLAALRFRLGRAALYYLAGILVLLLALLSPIHTLGEGYLFSAHMLQHLLLVQVVPPLLLMGIPASLAVQALGPRPGGIKRTADPGLRNPDEGRGRDEGDGQPANRNLLPSFFISMREVSGSALRGAEQVLGQPLVAWSLGIGAMWLWHLPVFYNATLEHASIHIIEHLCFLATATIFWWPIVGPLAERRLTPFFTALYLFAAMIASSVLGIILTFTPPGLYPAYLRPADTLGVLPLLRAGWGLTPAADQQLGGLLMWVPGSLVYLYAMLATLARWYRAPEEDIGSVAALERR